MTKGFTQLKFFLFSIFLIIAVASCQDDEQIIDNGFKTADEYSNEVALEWHYLYETISRYAPGYRPPAAARFLAYSGLAAYEAIVDGIPGYQSVMNVVATDVEVPEIDPDLEYHWPTVVNEVYAYLFTEFFPHIRQADKAAISALQNQFNQQFESEVSAEVFNRSKAHGLAVAKTFFEWSQTDEIGHNGYQNPHPSDYLPPQGPSLWQPTPPDYTAGLFPYWGSVRPFAVRGSDMVGFPPLSFSEDQQSAFYAQALEVYALTNLNDAELQWVGEFWSDDVFGLTFEPAGRWIAVLNQVIDLEKSDLATAVFAYAKMGMALCDTGIMVWFNKYIFNVERPVSYIQRVMDPNWETTLDDPLAQLNGVTPPFPAYPSGHSGFGGAAAEILKDVFGFSYAMTDRCHEGRTEFLGMPRSFNNFDEMAIENAISRVYLGVHYRMDCDEGIRMGALAGRRVNELPWRN